MHALFDEQLHALGMAIARGNRQRRLAIRIEHSNADILLFIAVAFALGIAIDRAHIFEQQFCNDVLILRTRFEQHSLSGQSEWQRFAWTMYMYVYLEVEGQRARG